MLSLNNYPNPFNPNTTISYSLPKAGYVSISIYNIKGQMIKTLSNESKPAGNHCIKWDGYDQTGKIVSSGTYYCKIESNGKSIIHKMILMK